jgi:hypothetical protein
MFNFEMSQLFQLPNQFPKMKGFLWDYVSFVKNVYGNVVANKVGTTTATNYWLASRLFLYSGATTFTFYGRCVGTSGDLYHGRFLYFNRSWIDSTSSRAVRPILTLKSGVSIASGSGTLDNPYTLN